MKNLKEIISLTDELKSADTPIDKEENSKINDRKYLNENTNLHENDEKSNSNENTWSEVTRKSLRRPRGKSSSKRKVVAEGEEEEKEEEFNCKECDFQGNRQISTFEAHQFETCQKGFYKRN